MTGRPLSPRHPAVRSLGLGLLIAFPLVLAIFIAYLPYTVDWYGHFELVARTPFTPYRSSPTYFNPPWFALLLSPLGWLPARIGQALNAYLNFTVSALVVIRYHGNRWGLVLTLTSLPFTALLLNGNVEWISMAAFLVPAQWGLPLIAAKPQTGGLAALIWFTQAKDKIRFVLPLAGVVILSFILWGWWPAQMAANIRNAPPQSTIDPNASPWPWLIPLGLVLLYFAWRREDEVLAVGATLCLIPYFVIHSATLFFALLAARWPRLAALAWVLLWAGAVIKNWHLLFP